MAEATAAAAGDSKARLRRAAAARISFPELVWAHFLRQRELEERVYEGEAEERYRRFLASFEADAGQIVTAYWSTNVASALAVTAQTRKLIGRLGWAPRYRLHRVTDWATHQHAAVARLMHDFEVIAVKAAEVLRGTSQRIMLERIFASMSLLLASVDRTEPLDDASVEALVSEQSEELVTAEKDYRAAAAREAQVVYFWGMMQGVVFQAAILVAVWFALILPFLPKNVENETVGTYLAAYGAGTVGALVSVLARMTGRAGFRVDAEIGRRNIRALGSFRPFIGGVFGLAIAFAVSSGLLHIDVPSAAGEAFFFLAFVAFLAGFSERFARDVFDDAGGRVLPPKEKEPPEPPEPPLDATTQGEAATVGGGEFVSEATPDEPRQPA